MVNKKQLLNCLMVGLTAGIPAMALAETRQTETKMEGNAAVNGKTDVVDGAAGSKDHTTLVAAIKAADLVSTLKGAGPFTVFAPTNDAFGKLPAGTLETLLKPENKAKLSGILTYHVVSGKVTASDLVSAIKAHHGTYKFKTVNGGSVTASAHGDGVALTDSKGNQAHVTTADMNESNGVIHVFDAVMMP